MTNNLEALLHLVMWQAAGMQIKQSDKDNLSYKTEELD